MRTLKIFTATLAVSAALIIPTTSCQVACIEDGSGTKCVAKSLKRFDGPPPPPQALDRAPGSPITIDVQYGNVFTGRSASGRVEVQFAPFVYAGYDDKPSADRQLAQNLRLNAASTPGGIVATVGRQGGSNGLGADVIVRIPDNFDGALNVVNRGGGPLNHFDVKIEYVGRAQALNVTNQSNLGRCFVQGAPTVRSTTVQCGEQISVFDVSDQVNITNNESSHRGQGPAVTLRLAGVSPNSQGGRIMTTSGSIMATFPGAGGYIINARSPVRGQVQEGQLPANCTKQEQSPAAKTLACGAGPTYELIAGTRPGRPQDSNVTLTYR